VFGGKLIAGDAIVAAPLRFARLSMKEKLRLAAMAAQLAFGAGRPSDNFLPVTAGSG
jgi:hypothetical protein